MGPAGDAAQIVLFGEWRGNLVVLDQALGLQHRHVTRGVGRLVDAILLGRIAGRCEVHAGAVVLGADHIADARFHPANRVGDTTTLVLGGVGLGAPLLHDRRQLGDVGIGEREFGAHLAAVGVTHVHRGALRFRNRKGRKVLLRGAKALVRASAGQEGRRYQ